MEVSKRNNGRRYSHAEHELAKHLSGAQLSQKHDKAPLASAVNDIPGESTRKVAPQRQRFWRIRQISVGDHLGRTIEDTPSIWTALRDTEYPLVSWGSGGVSGHIGDWTFWLYRRDGPGGNTVRLWAENLPGQAQGHVYSRQARRTDQASDQEYMYFDVDDAYPYVEEKPISEPGGAVAYSVRVIFVNSGLDTLSLQYKNYQGQMVRQTLQKGPSLGAAYAWVEHTFILTDAFFGNGIGGGIADFRLSCDGDGDEIVHFVEVKGHWSVPSEPTVAPEPTIAPEPSPHRLNLPIILKDHCH